MRPFATVARAVGWVEARDPRATVSCAAAGADADLGKSAPRIANGPRFATPGAGRIVKEQMHAQSIQAWLNLLQRALYPHNTQGISAPLCAGRELASQVQSLVALSASVVRPVSNMRSPLSPSPLLPFSPFPGACRRREPHVPTNNLRTGDVMFLCEGAKTETFTNHYQKAMKEADHDSTSTRQRKRIASKDFQTRGGGLC